MITSAHSIIYASDAEQARAFFRDVLELPYVDVHDGWLIFRLDDALIGDASIESYDVILFDSRGISQGVQPWIIREVQP